MSEVLSLAGQALSILAQLGVVGVIGTFFTGLIKKRNIDGRLAFVCASLVLGFAWSAVVYSGYELYVVELAKKFVGALGSAAVIYGFFYKKIDEITK